MLIYEFRAPLAATWGWQELFANEPFIWVAWKFVDRDVNCTTTAIKHHHDAVLDHLTFDGRFTVLSTLDTCSFRFKRQQEIAWILIIDDTSLMCGSSHEELMLLAPKGGNCQHPSDLGFNNFSDLLAQFFYGFICDKAQALRNHLHERQFSTVYWYRVFVHI